MNSKAAQKKVDDVVSQFSSEYKSLATEIASYIYKRLKAGVNISVALNSAFKLYNVDGWMVDKLTDCIIRSVAYGAGIETTPSMLNDPGFTKTALSMSYSASDVNLSKNIHRNITESKRVISLVVKQSIKNNQSIQKTALSIFDGYGYGKKIALDDVVQINKKLDTLSVAFKDKSSKQLKKTIKDMRVYVETLRTTPLRASYTELLDSIAKKSENAIEKSLYVALQEKSRTNAEMIAKTETSRAYGNAFESRAVVDPDVSGIKYSLTTGHSVFDICDMHTSVDFGFGEGVYPLSKIPIYPFHPRCTCRMSEVFKNELPDGAKISESQVEQSLNSYIENISDINRKKLVGTEAAESGKYIGNIRNYQGYKKAKVNSDLW
jgi:hypothetical protein